MTVLKNINQYIKKNQTSRQVIKYRHTSRGKERIQAYYQTPRE